MKFLLLIASTLCFVVVSTTDETCKFYTTDAWEYTYFAWEGQTFRFKVKARNDVHVICTTIHKPDLNGHNFLEVVVCGWNNTQSVVREEHLVGVGPYTRVITQTPGMISDQEYRGFWITIKDKCFSLGREGEECPIMVWHKPTSFEKFNYIGVCTGFGSDGYWLLPCDLKQAS